MPQKAPGLRKYGHNHVDDDPHFLGGFADYCYISTGRYLGAPYSEAQRLGPRGEPGRVLRYTRIKNVNLRR